MPADIPSILSWLRTLSLLSAERQAQLDEIARSQPSVDDLLRDLLRRDWLTAFQANRLKQGRGHELALGPYIILDRLGAGGLGEVYRVRHRELDRIQALKVITQRLLDSPEAVARFQREARILATLSHPNIVTIHDAGQIEGTWYLAMEFIDGIDLYHLLLKRGSLSVPEACECIRQSALGLAYVHQRGLVHRDVKPANLLHRMTEEGAIIKVVDLGLAGWLAPVNTDPARTPEGAVMGTPDYMAPEQIDHSLPVDARSDLYSLGCTLYHLLAGRPPFPEATVPQKLLAHLNQTPPPIETLSPDVPVPVARLVRRLMARRPQDRPASAAEVAQHLGPFCQSGPLPATTDDLSPPRLQRPCRRCLAGVGAMALTLLLLFGVWSATRPPRDRSPEEGEQQENAKDMFPDRDPVVLGDERWRAWDGISTLVSQPDGPLLAAVNQHGLVSLWDRKTGRLQKMLGKPQLLTRGLVWAPGGKSLAAGGTDWKVWLWRAPDWTLTRLSGHKEVVTAVVFSPDGKWLASGDNSGLIKIWRREDNTVVHDLKSDLADAGCICFSLDGKHLAAADEKGNICLWQTPGFKNELTFKSPAQVNAICFHPDHRRFLTAHPDNRIRLWDLTGTLTRTFTGHEGAVAGLAIDTKGKRLVSASWDTTIRLWDLDTGQELKKASRGWFRFDAVLFDPVDEALVYAAGEDGVIERWLPAKDQLLSPGEPGHRGTIAALAMLPGGRIATGSHDARLSLWEATTGKLLKSIKAHTGPILALARSPDGKSLATGGKGEHIKVWNGNDLTRSQSWRIPFEVKSLAWVDDTRVAVGGKFGTVHLYDAGRGSVVKRWPGHRWIVHGLARLDGGKVLATGDGSWEGEGIARLWPVDGPVKAISLPGHKFAAHDLAASPDGKTLATNDALGVVRLWSLEGKLLAKGPGHGAFGGGVAFSPDGRWLASSDLEGRVDLRDARTARIVRTWTLPGPVHRVAFTLDSSRLATANGNGTVALWRGEKK